MLEFSIKTPIKIRFSLHKKWGLVVRGALGAALYVYCYLENQFYVFQTAARGCLHSDVSIEYVTAPVSLTESVFM